MKLISKGKEFVLGVIEDMTVFDVTYEEDRAGQIRLEITGKRKYD